MPTTAQKRKYNRDAYLEQPYRVRKDSDLADRLAGYKAEGHSLTQLISELLAAHFGTALPMRIYIERHIAPLVEGGGIMGKRLEVVNREVQPDATSCDECFQQFVEAGDKKYVLPGGLQVCEECIDNYAVQLPA